MARVMVSVPSYDGVVKSLVDEAIGNMERGGHEVVHRNVSGYGIASARNKMARAALEGGFDYLMMVDSDTVPPADALENLMSNDKDVCLGYYVRGTSDCGLTNVVRLGAIDYENCYTDGELMSMCDVGVELTDVKAAGLGCALIRTRVFEFVQPPWFKFIDHPNGASFGEDYFFCSQCRGLGFNVYVDTRVRCGHIHERLL